MRPPPTHEDRPGSAGAALQKWCDKFWDLYREARPGECVEWDEEDDEFRIVKLPAKGVTA